MFIAKNRNGPDGMVYNIFMDTSNVCIKILPPQATNGVGVSNGTTTAAAPLGPRLQQQLLRDKYSKLKRKQ